MDWIHCNKCFRQPNEHDKTNLVITSCGTLLCLNCSKYFLRKKITTFSFSLLILLETTEILEIRNAGHAKIKTVHRCS